MEEISYFKGNMWISQDRYNEIFKKKEEVVLDSNINEDGKQSDTTSEC
jgi:hypothetical protein